MPRTFLGHGATAVEILRVLSDRARRLGLAPPAALTGSWFGVHAVIAPSVAITDTPADTFMDLATQATLAPAQAARIGGGWIGALHYPDGGERPPRALSGWCDEVLVLDDAGWWHENLTIPPTMSQGADTYHHLFDRNRHALSEEPQGWDIDWKPPDRSRHRRNVLACLDAIRAGEIYQACVGAHYTGHLNGQLIDVFCDGVTTSSPARAAYLTGAWGSIASLSPELFMSRRAQTVTSSPIKGTLSRSLPPEHLARSEKDIAENIMIVDLVRNDLGKLAEVGSVRVTDLLAVVPAPAVWHLVSTVTARVDPTVPNSSLISSAFPPASVTGTPKHRAQQLIAGWEPRPRGVYCGAIGMCSPIAGMELNVAIRTIEANATGDCQLGVGGGITIDSDPDKEWHECVVKGSSIVELHSLSPTSKRNESNPVSAAAPGS